MMKHLPESKSVFKIHYLQKQKSNLFTSLRKHLNLVGPVLYFLYQVKLQLLSSALCEYVTLINKKKKNPLWTEIENHKSQCASTLNHTGSSVQLTSLQHYAGFSPWCYVTKQQQHKVGKNEAPN